MFQRKTACRAARARLRLLRARISPLALLFHRSPLVKILAPEARVLTSHGVTDAVKWCVTAVTGLGAFDSVAGATAVVQVTPTANSTTVNYTAGVPQTFLYQITGAGGHKPATFQIYSGTLPAGLVRADIKNSFTDYISGAPSTPGSYPITIRAWEGSANNGRYAQGSFNIVVTAPPVPGITTPPSGTGTTAGSFVKLGVTHTNGTSFVWKKNGTAIPAVETVLVPRTAARKWKVPTADPGTTWRTDPAFVDTTWNSTSGGIGYDTNTTVNFAPSIATGGNTGSSKGYADVRIPFTLTNPAAVSYLKFRFQCDDGYVAWLNGIEISSLNKPSTLLWNSLATATVDDTVAMTWREVVIPLEHTSLLKAGTNLLAVQMLNQTTSSNDLLFNCEIAGGINTVNSPTLVLPAVRIEDTGSYTVTVSNYSGSVESAAAPVHILPSITGHPAGSTVGYGQTAQLFVTADGSALAYQWFTGPAGNTSNPVAGATSPTLTTGALTTTTSFWVRVSNPSGSADSTAASVTVNPPPPPVINGQPGSVTITSGNSATLNVTANGAGPFTYQWYRGLPGDTSQPQAGATLATFSTGPLSAAASFWVRVFNAGGGTDSSAAQVSVQDTLQSWSTVHFNAAELQNAAISGPQADPDRDGLTNEAEYVLGNNPRQAEAGIPINATASGGNIRLTFPTVLAGGSGYTGRARHYTVESCTQPAVGPWLPVAGASGIAATGGVVEKVIPRGPEQRTYYRLRVTLTP